MTGKQQVYEQTPYRGYLSTVQIEPHFGLGDVSKIDSVIIKWPDQKKQVFLNVAADETIIADHKKQMVFTVGIIHPFHKMHCLKK